MEQGSCRPLALSEAAPAGPGLPSQSALPCPSCPELELLRGPVPSPGSLPAISPDCLSPVTVTGHHWKSWSEAGLHLFCGSAPDNRPLLGQWLSLLSLAVWRLCTVPSPTPAAMKESLLEEHFGGSAVCNSCGLPGAGTAGPSVISPSSCWLSSACLLSQGVGLIQDY